MFHGAALGYVATQRLTAETTHAALTFATTVAARSVAHRGTMTWAEHIDAPGLLAT